MNNEQLSRLASSRKEIKKHFKGVYAVDRLPSHRNFKKPASLICNLDPMDEPGSHWIAFFLPEYGLPEYFDSYGRFASESCEHYLLRSYPDTKDYLYNFRFIQSPFSAVCGQYSLYYIWKRGLGYSMDEVLKIFCNDDHLDNDRLVNELIEDNFNVVLKVFDVSWQLSRHIPRYKMLFGE